MLSGSNPLTRLTRCPGVALVAIVIQLACLCPRTLAQRLLASVLSLAQWARAAVADSRWAGFQRQRARCRVRNVSSLLALVVPCLSLVVYSEVHPLRWYARLVKAAHAVSSRVASAARSTTRSKHCSISSSRSISTPSQTRSLHSQTNPSRRRTGGPCSKSSSSFLKRPPMRLHFLICMRVCAVR